MTFLRRIGLTAFLAGLAGLILYPVWFGTYHNVDLGTYRIHEARDGFRTIADVSLSPAAMPLRVEISGRGRVPPGGAEMPNLTLVLNGPRGTVAATVLELEPRSDGETAADIALEQVLTVDAGVGDGLHTFVFGEGDRPADMIAFLDMTLTGAVAAPDPRVRPGSYTLLGVGIAIMAIGGKRRRKKASDASDDADARASTSNIGRRVPLDKAEREPEKPARQWGRGEDS
ncbi:MAG: hypothetical protein JJ920_14195 [Roseitalea sp.]|jgi:hypothetical protein|nr:hypothetical protein [Roseitalea sp.]MBO6723022.1 hypothetical protein [Roseitalea sp.]MBO6744060.1 hypothetical protein [Roseitalea sp.]